MESIMTSEKDIPRSNVKFKVIPCPTIEALQTALNKYWNAQPYWIPQENGCWLILSIPDMEAIEARMKPRIVLGMKPLTEFEAQNLVKQCKYGDKADNFLTWAYENGFKVFKEVETKKK